MALLRPAAGGVVGLVKEGDIIEICVQERRIRLAVSDTVLSKDCLTRNRPTTIAAGDIVQMGELPFALEITAKNAK